MSLNDPMLHPTILLIIKGLDESVRKLQEELATARADEREACERAIEDLLPDADRGDCAAAIRARRTT